MIKQYLTFTIIFVFTIVYCFTSCSGNENQNRLTDYNTIPGQYSIYIINYSFHTGIVIPVNEESLNAVAALDSFKKFSFADIGWGEEKFYQNPDESFCMGAKAVLLPNSSVIRIEGYNSTGDFILWSNYVVQLTLTKEQYAKILKYIDKSFFKKNSYNPVITSGSSSGSVIFFSSVYKYHLFNTCNTWIAKALKISGLDVSSFLTITADQLYDQIKDKGRVVKAAE